MPEPSLNLFADLEEQEEKERAEAEATAVSTTGGFTEAMQKRAARALFEYDQRRSFGPNRDEGIDEAVWRRVEKHYTKAAGVCLKAAHGGSNAR